MNKKVNNGRPIFSVPPIVVHPMPYDLTTAEDDQANWGWVGLKMRELELTNQGENALVVVMDTAGEITHPDLSQNVLTELCLNFTDSETNQDKNGHGTGCLSIATSLVNNKGTIGYAPKAYKAAMKVLNDVGIGYLEWIEAAGNKLLEKSNYYGVDETKPLIKILTLSLGAQLDEGIDPIGGMFNKLIEDGWIIFAAAGNDGGKLAYPGLLPQLITVGSFGPEFKPSVFSNFGPVLDMSMPGELIYSAWSNDSYKVWTGTSASTPAAAGCAARIVSQHYGSIKNQADFIEFMKDYHVDIDAKGHDIYTGSGYFNMPSVMKSKEQEEEEQEEEVFDWVDISVPYYYNPYADVPKEITLPNSILGLENRSIYVAAKYTIQSNHIDFLVKKTKQSVRIATLEVLKEKHDSLYEFAKSVLKVLAKNNIDKGSLMGVECTISNYATVDVSKGVLHEPPHITKIG